MATSGTRRSPRRWRCGDARFALLRDKEAVRILFRDLAPRFRDRAGGYTRVVRLSTCRLGDGGPQAILEFVGENDRVKTRRRSRADGHGLTGMWVVGSEL